MDGKEFTELLKKQIEEEGREGILYGKEIVFIPAGTKARIPAVQDLFRQVNNRHFQKETDELLGDFLAVRMEAERAAILVWAEPLLACADDLGMTEAFRMLKERLRWHLGGCVKEAIHALGDYKQAAPHLILRPLFFDPSDSRMEENIYRRIGDMALVLYMVIPSEDKDSLTTIRITKEIFEPWEMDRETVLEAALENTCRKAPAVLGTEMKFLFNGMDPLEEAMEIPLSFSKEKEFCIMTHKSRVNGAIALFYPGMMERIYQMFGDDYYVVFMSIHECALHRVNTTGVKQLEEILKEINDTFNQNGDKLSERVYRYDGKKKELIPAVEEV